MTNTVYSRSDCHTSTQVDCNRQPVIYPSHGFMTPARNDYKRIRGVSSLHLWRLPRIDIHVVNKSTSTHFVSRSKVQPVKSGLPLALRQTYWQWCENCHIYMFFLFTRLRKWDHMLWVLRIYITNHMYDFFSLFLRKHDNNIYFKLLSPGIGIP
jgi:hypothetical protein